MEQSSLTDSLEDTILRTRKIMQESKAITMKNLQRKNMLEERFLFNNLHSDKDSSMNTSEIVRKISEIDLRNNQETPERTEDSLKFEQLKNTISELHEKVQSQATRIQELESNLAELNLQKAQLTKELELNRQERCAADSFENSKNLHSSNRLEESIDIEQKIAIMEEKYKRQVIENNELLEKIKRAEHRKMESDRVQELEEMLLASMEKYRTLQERLEKTESLILIENKSAHVSPKSLKKVKFSSPKGIIHKSVKKPLRKHNSAYIKPN